MVGVYIKTIDFVDSNGEHRRSPYSVVACKYDGTNIQEVLGVAGKYVVLPDDGQPFPVILTHHTTYVLSPDRYVVIDPQYVKPLLYTSEEFEAKFQFVQKWEA